MLLTCAFGALVIFAGAKLLIQCRQEALKRFYRLISWFLILLGFYIVIGSAFASFISCSGIGNQLPCGSTTGMLRHFDHSRMNSTSCTHYSGMDDPFPSSEKDVAKMVTNRLSVITEYACRVSIPGTQHLLQWKIH